MISGQTKSQNEKFENQKKMSNPNIGFTLKFPKNIFLVVFFQKKCQILKYWFYTKIPKKYFFGHIFPKNKLYPSILRQKESGFYQFPSITPILTK